MPSLHFATSVTAAHVLSDTGKVAGTFGWAYALTLGVALVYLGEHYVVDLMAGLALAESIQLATPTVAKPAIRFSRAVQALERMARV
jgi:membrane-associated phospholipid phosphatase